MTTKPLSHLHRFKVWGDRFVLNISTSRFYKINQLMDRILGSMMEGKSMREITGLLDSRFPPDQIINYGKKIEEMGLLGNGGSDETDFEPPTDHPLDTLDLQISHRCNLDCKYCYAQGGSFGGEDRVMASETACRAIDFFLEHSDSQKTLSISFDGGEPLINFDVIRDAARYARERGETENKKIGFTVGTNATLVTEDIAEFMSQYHFSPQVSLDGNEKIQDELRPRKNGGGSYRQVLAGIDMFTRKGIKLASRITITPRNLNLKDNVEILYNLGVIRIAAFPATGIPGPYAFGPAEVAALKEELDKTAEFFLDILDNEGKFVPFANFTDNIKNLRNAQILHYGCGAARKFISVDPYGDIFPCHRLVGNRKFRLGNLRQGMKRQKRGLFLDNHVDTKEKCRQCWAKYLCGGGCLVEAEFAGGDIKTPYEASCEIFRHERELSMMLFSRIHTLDKSLIDKVP